MTSWAGPRPGPSQQPITARDPGLGGGASGLDGWVWQGAPPLVLVGCDWRWAGEGAPPQACWLWGLASRLARAGQGAPPQAGWPPGWLAAGWAGQGAPPNHKQNFLSLNLKTLDLNLKTLDLNLKTLTNVLRHLRIFLRHLS